MRERGKGKGEMGQQKTAQGKTAQGKTAQAKTAQAKTAQKKTAQTLAKFLESKRWFGEKGRGVLDANLRDVIPVTWPNARKDFAVGRARVTTDEGTFVYQLFLPGDDSIAEALDDPEFRRGLADGFQNGATFEKGGARWIVASEGKTPLVVPATVPVTLSSSEQTNSSVIIDGEAILKLYRKLEPGIHPDVEVTRFLTATGFVHVPVLLGTIRFEDSDGVTIAGMLQELVPGAVDGWTYALDCSAGYFGASEAREGGAMPFEAQATELGGVTREMHHSLASGAAGTDFGPQTATPDDMRRWVDHATRTIDRACAALERALAEKRLPDDRVSEARAVMDRRSRYLAWTRQLAKEVGGDAGANSRTHGDYHLGQVLRSAADRFLIIDFEGEPTRPLRERRARHSPLRDVAGMLRSFAYAAAVGAGGVGSGVGGVGNPKPHSPNPKPAVLAEKWESSIRAAFLRGYFSERNEPLALLPRSQSNAGRLLSLFEAEKAFYELQYEMDHRPDWVWIPLRGIASLYS